MSILDWSLTDTGYAVVAIKTTGLTPRYDGICEIAIAQVTPGQPLLLALDTLVDPGRPIAGAEIHGIKNRHITMNTPSFREVGLDLVRQLQGRVLVGHNLAFTMRFLGAEMKKVGIPLDIPYIDTMSLASMLTKTPPRPLLEACEAFGVEADLEPTAAACALDTARLFRAQVRRLAKMRLHTIGRIRGKQRYPFQQSLDHVPLPKGFSYGLMESVARVSRREDGIDTHPDPALSLYWDSLMVAFEDLEITDAELGHLLELKNELELDQDQVNLLHARVFSGLLVTTIDSGACGPEARLHLASVHGALSALGWAPGTPEDAVTEG